MLSKTIRSLGAKEINKLTSDWTHSFSQSTRVTSTLDLFANFGLLNQTIRQWSSMHPLLQAKVASIDGENHFVYDDRFVGKEPAEWTADQSDLYNVKYLRLDPGSKIEDEAIGGSFYDDLSCLLVNRELITKFDPFNELLWRVIIFEITGARSDSNCHEYYFTLSFYHGACEGRNNHMLMLQLFDLIEFNWTSPGADTLGKLRSFPVQPSVEDMYFNNFDRSKHNNQRMSNLPLVTWPSYMDPYDASRCSAKAYEWESQLADEWIYQMETKNGSSNQHELIRIGNLVSESRQAITNARRFTLSKHQTSMFLEKCKIKKCTITMALSNLMGYALKKLDLTIKQQKGLESSRQQFNAQVIISMRQFEPTLQGLTPPDDFIDQLSMGFHVSSTMMALDHLIGMEYEKLGCQKEFWTSCSIDTANLKDIVERKEMFFPLVIKENRQPTESYSSHAVSSLGAVPNKLPDKYALSARECFQIQKAYIDVSVHQKDFASYGPIYLYTSTCNRHLNMSFFNYPYLISHSNMDKFLETFFSLLHRVLE